MKWIRDISCVPLTCIFLICLNVAIYNYLQIICYHVNNIMEEIICINQGIFLSYNYKNAISFFTMLSLLSVQFSHSAASNTLWRHAAVCQASMSIANSQNSLKLMSIESVMPSNDLILCRPLILPPSVFPSIGVFSNESVLCIRRPKYCSFSFSISPSMNIQDWFPLGWTGWISLQSKGLSRVFSNTTVQKYQFLGAQLSL